MPWCGLFIAIVADRADIERRPERNPPRLYLSALEWTMLDYARLRDQARACVVQTR